MRETLYPADKDGWQIEYVSDDDGPWGESIYVWKIPPAITSLHTKLHKHWETKRWFGRSRTLEECFMLALEYIGKFNLKLAVDLDRVAQLKDFAQEIVKDL